MINTSKIDSLPLLNDAVERSNINREDYSFKQASLQDQINSTVTSDTLNTTKIAKLDKSIQSQQAALLVETDPVEKEFIDQTIADLQAQKQTLVDRESDIGEVAILRRYIDMADYSQRIPLVDEYLITLDGLRPTLPSA
jgi:hypothetical protein